jgi:transposase
MEEDIEKSKIELDKINDRLKNPKSRFKKDIEELQKNCDSKLKGRYVRNIIKINISQNVIVYEVDEKEKKNISDKYFGKKLTITDHANWTTEAILEAYYDQDCIEKIFRDTKNNDRGCMQPIYHWTDQKIKAHMYICLLAQILMGILQKLMFDTGIHISKEKMMDELELIRESWVKDVSHNKNKKTGGIKRQLEEMTPKQKLLWEVVQKIES